STPSRRSTRSGRERRDLASHPRITGGRLTALQPRRYQPPSFRLSFSTPARKKRGPDWKSGRRGPDWKSGPREKLLARGRAFFRRAFLESTPRQTRVA